MLINPDGQIVARYRKIHLFDVDLDDGSRFRESNAIAAGRDVVIAQVDNITVGLTVCYDVRFPELFRTLAARGAQVLFVPSAFTVPTGTAHWQILLRARAIENQAFVVAAAQVGRSAAASPCYGHSLIVDPWGRVLSEASADEESLVMADLDFDQLERIRRDFATLAHRRNDVDRPVFA